LGGALKCIEDGGQHHFILQICNPQLKDGFKRLQWIGHDAGANDDLVCGARLKAGAVNSKLIAIGYWL